MANAMAIFPKRKSEEPVPHKANGLSPVFLKKGAKIRKREREVPNLAKNAEPSAGSSYQNKKKG